MQSAALIMDASRISSCAHSDSLANHLLRGDFIEVRLSGAARHPWIIEVHGLQKGAVCGTAASRCQLCPDRAAETCGYSSMANGTQDW